MYTVLYYGVAALVITAPFVAVSATQREPARRKTGSPRRRARSRSEAKTLRAIAERVREARVRAGLTQEDAAASAGIDYKRWQRIEQGAVNPTIATLARIASALKMTLSVTFE
jgi:ribosome-binding protein aMBF1 (putative translation factor)